MYLLTRLPSGVGYQRDAQSSETSETSARKPATDPSPAMVKYLEEQDAYKFFLVGEDPASRKTIEEAGSKTERAWDGVRGGKVHITGESISMQLQSRYGTSTKIDCMPEKPKI